MDLEEQLILTGKELGIAEQHQEKIVRFLGELREHHEPTFEHAIRVGLTSHDIARFMHLNPRPAYYGVLHDIGKTQIPLEVLGKSEGFNAQDMEVMKHHVLYGHRMLHEAGYTFSAWLALMHHRYQKNLYPETLPQKPSFFGEGTSLLVDIYSRIIAIADQNDALKRRNDKYGSVEMKAQRAQQIMLDLNKDQAYLINELYAANIIQ